VANPEQKLKPGMTANLTITIDERNNVVKVPNAALRFTPQATTAGQGNQNRANRADQGGRGGAAQQGANANGAANANASDAGAQQSAGGRGNFAPPTAPVLEGQTRRVWVLGADGKVQPRRIKVGLSDGASTEVVEGELKEGDVVVTGQTVTGAQRAQTSAQSAPGFGGAPRGGGGAGGGGRR
jgi:HlyD family secretion protein